MGYSVGFGPNLELDGAKAYGITDTVNHLILIDRSLSWDARFSVLAHEGGHVLEPGWSSTAQGECFAEMVSTLVAHDGLREHARYLARFKVEAIVMLLTEWPAIYNAAAVLEAE